MSIDLISKQKNGILNSAMVSLCKWKSILDRVRVKVYKLHNNFLIYQQIKENDMQHGLSHL